MIFSIITITSNDPGLFKTLDSVKSQTINSKQLEHIIIDNLSTDDTPSVVSKYQKSVKYPVKYLREKDSGRFNAMNKGINLAVGDYLLFLNAGDTLHHPNVLKKALPFLKSDIVYGDVKGKSLKKHPVNLQFFIDRTFFHQATFINRNLFSATGPYDESLQIVGDFDFFMRAILKYGATTSYLPLVITNYDTSGISSTGSAKLYAERALVVSRYTTGTTKNYHLLKYLYYHYQHLFPRFLVHSQQKRLYSKKII